MGITCAGQAVSAGSYKRWSKMLAAGSVVGGLALLMTGGSVRGATLFWDTDPAAGITTGSTNWDFNTHAEWNTDAAGSNTTLVKWTDNSDTASFVIDTATVTVDDSHGQVGAQALNFTGSTAGTPALTIRTGSLQLGAGGISDTVAVSGSVVTISAPLVLTASQTWSTSNLRFNNTAGQPSGAVVSATGGVSSLSGTTNLTFDGLGVSNGSGTANSAERAAFALGLADTFSGTTTVTGGAALVLNYSAAKAGSRLDDNSALILDGGSIVMNGGSNLIETVASTTVGAGENTLYAGSSGGGSKTVSGVTTVTNNIALGALTHETGGILDVTNAVTALANTTTMNTDGIIGGWATEGFTTWATGSSDGVTSTAIGGTAGSSEALSAALTTDNVSSNANESNLGNKTVNALRVGNANGTLGFASGSILTITSGGLMSGSTGQSITGGTIRPGTASGELFVHNINAFTIGSAIADNGGTPTILVKADAGMLTLSGTTSYTGGTYINAGTLQITGASSIRGSVIQQGATTLDVRSTGTIAPGTAATAGTMTLGGNLTLEDGAVMNIRLGTSQDLINLTNSFATLTGSTSADGITLNLLDNGGITGQAYTLMQWAPGTTLASFDLSDFDVTPPAGTTGTLQFGTNSLEFVVNSTSAVPEPASLGLLAIGSLGLLVKRRRRA